MTILDELAALTGSIVAHDLYHIDNLLHNRVSMVGLGGSTVPPRRDLRMN